MPTPDVSSTSAELRELLVMDLFFFPRAGGRIEPRTGHLLVYRMSLKTSSALQSTIGRILAFYIGHSHTVRVIRTDREANFFSWEDILAAHACNGPEQAVMPKRLNRRRSSRAAAQSNVQWSLHAKTAI